MSKKKIVVIVVTLISVAVSAVACALGIPYTPVEIDYEELAGEDTATVAVNATDVAAGICSALSLFGEEEQSPPVRFAADAEQTPSP